MHPSQLGVASLCSQRQPELALGKVAVELGPRCACEAGIPHPICQELYPEGALQLDNLSLKFLCWPCDLSDLLLSVSLFMKRTINHPQLKELFRVMIR